MRIYGLSNAGLFVLDLARLNHPLWLPGQAPETPGFIVPMIHVLPWVWRPSRLVTLNRICSQLGSLRVSVCTTQHDTTRHDTTDHMGWLYVDRDSMDRHVIYSADSAAPP